jgi:hypothetical protein
VSRILIISSLLLLGLFSSCTGSKKAAKKAASGAELSAEEALTRVRGAFLEFESLHSNVELYVKTSMFSGSVNAKLRMVKDSVIWLSATKLGFEVGRVLITKDSVFMVERLQRTYIQESFETLSDMAQFTFDYKFLEDFMIGNPYLHETINEVSYINRDSFTIRPILEQVKIEHTIDNKDYKLLETTVQDDKTKMFGDLEFQDYRALSSNEIFSYFRSIRIYSGDDEENAVSIKFINPELNVEKEIKFSIPPSYTPRKF